MCKMCGNPCGNRCDKPCCLLTTSGAGNPPVGMTNRIYTNTLTGVTYIIDSEGVATPLVVGGTPLIDRFQEFDNLTSGNSVTVSIAPDPTANITVVRNGAVQFESASADYVRSGSTFTFNVPFGSVAGGAGAEKVRIEYKSN
jgi:hypothetical protein